MIVQCYIQESSVDIILVSTKKIFSLKMPLSKTCQVLIKRNTVIANSTNKTICKKLCLVMFDSIPSTGICWLDYCSCFHRNLLIGVLKPSKGEVAIYGKNVVASRGDIGFCPQHDALFDLWVSFHRGSRCFVVSRDGGFRQVWTVKTVRRGAQIVNP